MSIIRQTELFELEKALNAFNTIIIASGAFGTDDDPNPAIYPMNKFARASNLPSGDWATIWDGNTIYPLLTSEIEMVINSTSPSDVSVIVKIYYVNENWERKNIEITLNGTTNVSVATDIMIPYRMKVISENSTVGTINLQNVTNTVTYATILNGANEYNKTQMSIFPVPANYTFIIMQIGASTGLGKSVELQLRQKPFDEANKIIFPTEVVESTFEISLEVPYVINEKTFLEVRGKATGTNIASTAFFDGFLIRNDILQEISNDIVNLVGVI